MKHKKAVAETTTSAPAKREAVPASVPTPKTATPKVKQSKPKKPLSEEKVAKFQSFLAEKKGTPKTEKKTSPKPSVSMPATQPTPSTPVVKTATKTAPAAATALNEIERKAAVEKKVAP
eukprot:PhM_4_TR12556/c0_g1_i1/m.7499